MKKYYVTQSCAKFTPILKVFYKNIKSLNFFDGLIVYTDDKDFMPDDTFVNVVYGKDKNYSSNLKNALASSGLLDNGPVLKSKCCSPAITILTGFKSSFPVGTVASALAPLQT